MNVERPSRLLEAGWDRGFVWMVALSLVLHLAIGSVIVASGWSAKSLRPPTTAYTVELTDASVLGSRGASVGPLKPKAKVASSKAPERAPKVAQPPAAAKSKKPKAPKQAGKEVPKKAPKEVPKKAEAKPTKTEVAKKAPPPAPKPVEHEKVALAKKPAPKPAKPKVQPAPAAKAEPAPKADKKPPAATKKDDAPLAPDGTATRKGGPADGADPKRAEGGADAQYLAAIERVRERTGGGGGAGPASIGPQGEGGGNQVVGSDFLIYYNIMMSSIREEWVWVGDTESVEATVRFSIGNDGEIRQVTLAKSSGDASYDESVIRAVREANPLPPPPERYRKRFGQEGVQLTFRPADLQAQ